ncbi:MAG: hypothetical protein ACOWWR_18470 [Eubacteriales bacterium]
MVDKKADTPGVAPEKGYPTEGQAKQKPDDLSGGIISEEEAQRLVDLDAGKQKEPKVSDEKVQDGSKEKSSEAVKPEEDKTIDRYKGKTNEELVAIIQEKEKYIQERSNKIGDLSKENSELAKLKEQVKSIEDEALKSDIQNVNVGDEPIPPSWDQDKFISDPKYLGEFNKQQNEYQKKFQEWSRKRTMAMMAPFVQSETERVRNRAYDQLEEKYKDYPVKVKREDVQEFLNNNPIYFKKYGKEAYEKAYTEHMLKKLPDLSKQQETLKEEVRKEIENERKTRGQAANVGMNDLVTSSSGENSTNYDEARMETDPVYRDQVLADMERRNNM